MNIENVKAVHDSCERLQVIFAKIDGVQHSTADIRDIAGETYAVFSNFTDNKILMSGIIECVKSGIYTETPLEVLSISSSHFIFVKVKY